MITDLAKIEAALKAATPGPWEASGHDSGHSMYELDWYVVQPEAGDAICDLESYERVTCNERHAQTTAEADAHLIANAPAWLAELVERVKAAEAEVERATWAEGSIRAELDAAEAAIARVRALAEEHPGTAWNSGLNLRQALRDALGGTPTDAPEGADSADDERNRFSGEDARDATEPILRPGAHRAPCVDGDVCGEPSNCPPARCASNITLRDEEHRLVMCALPDAHDGDHDDRNGVTWTAEILRPTDQRAMGGFVATSKPYFVGDGLETLIPPTDQRYEPPADDHESGCCR